MPKYYRFRPTSPTRRIKRNKDEEKDKEISKNEMDMDKLDFTLACSATPSWYLRRISWRDSHPPLMGLPRQLSTGIKAELQINNRPILYFKIPSTLRAQDMIRLF